jgi:hypothetical protein
VQTPRWNELKVEQKSESAHKHIGGIISL